MAELVSSHPKSRGNISKSNLRLICGAFRCALISWLSARNEQFRLSAAARSAVVNTSKMTHPKELGAFSCIFAADTLIQQTPENVARSASLAVENAAAAAGTGATSIHQCLRTLTLRAEIDFDLNKVYSSHLWDGAVPKWSMRQWSRLSSSLLKQDKGWAFWINWYEAVLVGKSSVPTKTYSDILRIPESVWLEETEIVNAEISKRLEYISEDDETPTKIQSLDIPPLRAAAIEPIVRGDRLTLSGSSIKSDLERGSLPAALKALKNEITSLVSDLQFDNIDPRFSVYLQKLERALPTRAPKQIQLFEVAHKLEVLESYSDTVNEEWPNLLAARYHSMVRAYDRTMRQFPKWREFNYNASISHTMEIAGTKVESATVATVDALRDNSISDHIDSRLPSALDKILASLDLRRERDFIPVSKSKLQSDILDSINNTFKTIASAAIESLSILSDAAIRGAHEFNSAAAVSYKKQMKTEGGKAGRAFARWQVKVFISIVSAGIAGSALELSQWLAATFPHYFSWLTPVVTFLINLH